MHQLSILLFSCTLVQTGDTPQAKIQAQIEADMRGRSEWTALGFAPSFGPGDLREIVKLLPLPDPPRPVRQPGSVSVTRLSHKVPKAARKHFERALTLAKKSKYAEAARELEQAVALDAGFSDAHNNLGVQYFMLGRPQDAEKAFSRAVELDSASVSPHINLANLALAKGDFATAEKEAHRALTIGGGNEEALRVLSLVSR